MSNGTNIIDQIRGLAPDANIMTTAISGFRDVPTSTDTLPATEITQFIDTLSGLLIPDGSQAAEERQDGLRQLLEGGISTPEDFLSPLTTQFTRLQQLITGDVLQSFTELFGPFGEIFTTFPSDPSSLLSVVRESLVAVLDILVKDTQILGLQRYSEQIEQVSALISGNPQEAANFIQAQIEETTTTTTGPSTVQQRERQQLSRAQVPITMPIQSLLIFKPF